MSGAVLAAMVSKTVPLVVTLSAGATQIGVSSGRSYDFGMNSAVVTGGSGSYSYAWTFVPSSGTWALGAPTASATDVSVSGAFGGAGATVTCTVTDTASGRVGHAQTAYSYAQFTPPDE